jgi:SSS family solute:Na+ symporter
MVRLGLEIKKSTLMVDGIWYRIADLNFLYFAIFSFLTCIVVLITVSMVTPPPDANKINGLTYDTTKRDNQEPRDLKSDKINSYVILAILALILLYFSPIGIGG